MDEEIRGEPEVCQYCGVIRVEGYCWWCDDDFNDNMDNEPSNSNQ